MTKTRTRRAGHNEHDYAAGLRDGVHKITEGVREITATAGTAAKAQVDPIGDYVREYPIQSMLIAAGVGAVLGLLFLRR